MLSELTGALANPSYAVGGVSILMVFCGYVVLTKMKADSPFAPYALQILGLTFILPIVLLAGIVLKLESQAVVGLLGTIIGYIFGSSRLRDRRRTRNRLKHEDNETE